MSRDRQTKTYTGNVVRRKFAKGSKSERFAIVLATRYGDLLIRLQEGHPFFDKELDELVGKRIRATGIRHRHVFILEDWCEVTSPRGRGSGRTR